MSFTLQFTRRFSMAHRLSTQSSPKCSTPHGHNEYVTVDITGPGENVLCGDRNMLREFSEIKRAWHGWIDDAVDHCLQLSEHDDMLVWIDEHHPDWKVMVTPGDPTTELSAALLMAKCQAFLDADGQGLQCTRLSLQETPTNTVILTAPAPDTIIAAGPSAWWCRADLSIR